MPQPVGRIGFDIILIQDKTGGIGKLGQEIGFGGVNAYLERGFINDLDA